MKFLVIYRITKMIKLMEITRGAAYKVMLEDENKLCPFLILPSTQTTFKKMQAQAFILTIIKNSS